MALVGGGDGSAADRNDASGGDTKDGGDGATTDASASEVATTCPVVSFTSPVNMTKFTAADDASGMSCAGGFKHDVTVAVTAVTGTVVELHGAVVAGNVASPPLLATSTVTNNVVTFKNVQLSEGSTTLSIEIAGVKCTPTVAVSVDCKLPTCTVSAPTHDTLNGVPAPGGDRASSAGSDYQAAFAVTTDIEDGQPVVLSVTAVATPTATPATVTANAMSGVATFAGVTLKPDGQYKISATCTNKANLVGHSMNPTFTVDTTPPVLNVTQPMNGDSLSPTDLTNGAFKVCATTTSVDAVNVPMSAATASGNLCVTHGQTTDCTPVTAVSASTCVNVACPGGAPFDLTVKLFDAAGNPQTSTVTGISCASTLPSVEIVSPQTDTPNFADGSKRLLSAKATQLLKDADGAMAGAQATVVACTDTMGGSAKLFVGHDGDATLTVLGAPVVVVAAVAADNCSAGKGYVAKFVGVTLPESTEAADGTLMAATELRVDVSDPTNLAAVGTSGPTDLWVDSIDPTLSEKLPMPLCGAMLAAPAPSTTLTTDVSFNSNTSLVALKITNGMAFTFGPPTFAAGAVTFSAVDFPQGANLVEAVATDPAGNVATLTPPVPMPTCTVTVGSAPVVTFTAPGVGKNLCANGNALATCVADATPGAGAAAGWQGDITVHVTVDGVPLAAGNVAFTIAGGAPQTAALNATGDATLTGITIADAAAVVLTATSDTIAGHGAGTATRTVIVDTQAPGGPTAVTATVLDRRKTSFTLGWTTPDDNGQTVAGYDIHVKVKDPVGGDPCGKEVVSVPFTGTPVATGSTQLISISNLFIETDYCFTITAKDAVGNLGPIANGMGRANFNTTLLSNPGGAIEDFGFFTDGTGDLGSPGTGGFVNDGKADLLVGTLVGQHAYVYFGKTTGYSAMPDITFTGPANRRFGATVINAGDLDGDGLSDIAIGAPGTLATDPPTIYIFSRKTAPWAVGGGWPTTLSSTDASYTITAPASYGLTFFGYAMARLGNFDGSGRGDLAIGAFNYSMGPGGTNAGRVVIVKGSDTFGSITLPDAANTIVIDGEATGDRLGRAIEILSDNTLVVSAANSAALAGKLYAFRWPLLATQVASATTAADISTLATANAQYGLTLTTLGPLGPSLASVVAGAVGAGGNFVDVHLAPVSEGIFVGASGSVPVPTVRFTSSTTPGGLGANLIGAPPGLPSAMSSLVGNDAVPDLVIAGQGDATNAIYVVSGTLVSSLSGAVDLATSTSNGLVVLRNKLPAAWTAYGPGGFVNDLDGDGYADFVLGESGTTKAGRALVFW
jgi:hypothetical protein